jgi:GxxExxY protein
MQKNIIYKEESYKVNGAIFEVYRQMGSGFLEAVYQECLGREFHARGIPYHSQKDLPLMYKGERLSQTYRVDFVCYDKMIIEIKAVKNILNEHRAQVFNYLKSTGFHLGLLANFGHSPLATIERIVFDVDAE